MYAVRLHVKLLDARHSFCLVQRRAPSQRSFDARKDGVQYGLDVARVRRRCKEQKSMPITGWLEDDDSPKLWGENQTDSERERGSRQAGHIGRVGRVSAELLVHICTHTQSLKAGNCVCCGQPIQQPGCGCLAVQNPTQKSPPPLAPMDQRPRRPSTPISNGLHSLPA